MQGSKKDANKVPASEFAHRYGWPESAVVSRIRAGIYDGFEEHGTWYVLRPLSVLPEPQKEAQPDVLKAALDSPLQTQSRIPSRWSLGLQPDDASWAYIAATSVRLLGATLVISSFLFIGLQFFLPGWFVLFIGEIATRGILWRERQGKGPGSAGRGRWLAAHMLRVCSGLLVAAFVGWLVIGIVMGLVGSAGPTGAR